jgi:hypothetical protein
MASGGARDMCVVQPEEATVVGVVVVVVVGNEADDDEAETELVDAEKLLAEDKAQRNIGTAEM